MALPAGFWAGFVARTSPADDKACLLFADADMESSVGSVHGDVAPHHRSPTTANKPAGQDSKSPEALGTGDSTALVLPRCQSFFDNKVAQFKRLAPIELHFTNRLTQT